MRNKFYAKHDPKECKRGGVQTCNRLTHSPAMYSLLPSKCVYCDGVTCNEKGD